MDHNLADPSFEPTDEQLRELSRSAFSHIAEARRQIDLVLQQEIDRLRKEVLLKLHEAAASP